MKNIYVISGLGADHTVFSKLKLANYHLVHIQWVKTNKGESLAQYAKRLLPQIKEENPIVLGLSLGGMLALEVAKLIPTKKTISLSSIINYKELPIKYKIAGWLRLQKIAPVYAFSKGNRFTHWMFGVKKKEDKIILNAVFNNLDKDFLYWALNAVLNWKNNIIPASLIRIHGTADLILPKKKKSDYNCIIQKGTHLMLLDQSDIVSKEIIKQLDL